MKCRVLTSQPDEDGNWFVLYYDNDCVPRCDGPFATLTKALKIGNSKKWMGHERIRIAKVVKEVVK